MSKFIKNNSGTTKTWQGQQVLDQEYYNIQPNEEILWANNSALLSDIGSSDAIVAKDSSGTTDINDINDAINYLKGNLPTHVKTDSSPAFSAKTLPDGRKLFRRKHGISQTITASSTEEITFSVPYAQAKITKAEIINGKAGDCVDLTIHDDASGTYSTVPNYKLNQFGFGVCISEKIYVDESQYDADLYFGMVIKVTYTNHDTVDKKIGINLTLHEVV